VVVDGFDEIFLKMEEAYAAQHADLSARLCISAPPSDLDSKKLFDLFNTRNFTSLRSQFVQLNDLGHFTISAEGLTKGLVSVFGG
jgi:hypothetical protein